MSEPLPARARAVPAVAFALFALHMTLAERYGVFRDEMYYVSCGRHLAWGYVDHPPLVAVMARISDAIFGASVRGLRVWPALCAAATVVLAGELARAMRGGSFAQLLAAVCVAVCPELLGIDHFLSMNCVLPALWSAAALFAIRALVQGRPRAWLGFGVACGIALLAKHSTLFFGAAFAVALLAGPERRALATRWPWIALGVAALCLAPNVAWEITHGWPTLEFMHNAQQYKMVRFGPLTFMKEVALVEHPALLPVWVAGLVWLFRSRAYRFVGVAYVATIAIVIAGGGKPYYVSGIFPIGFAAGGVAIEAWVARRWARAAIVGAAAALGLAMFPMALPILEPEPYRAYAAALHIEPASDEKHAKGPLPQHFADQFGWEHMAARVAGAYRALAPEEQGAAVIYATNYGEAGAIDFFRDRYGLPPVVSGHNAYYEWGTPPGRGAVLIAIAEPLEDLEKTYEDCRLVDRTDEPYAMPFEAHVPIHVCRKPKRALDQVWPETKHYI